MKIGAVSEAVNLPSKTIRYYEDIALVVPGRLENGYRDYSDEDINKLRLVARARRLGFDLDGCRGLLSLYADSHRASADVKAIAKAHFDEIDRKIEELISLRDALRPLLHACKGNEEPDCAILADLVQPTIQKGA